MAYLLGIKLLKNKALFFALRDIFGIGLFCQKLICRCLGFCINFKTSGLSKIQINKILRFIGLNNFILETNLRKFKALAIKKLVDLTLFKGLKFNKPFSKNRLLGYS